ncbi:hypothetical protein HYPSUDRAFT_473830 [Hypholoma sublateritium FD-334 SS-4]|uniref:Uncharacterized protein n=1 Tax=Hypholoma sublateritium (strain FD-334 SS-4) TaxID=945553 RepID=A0A0D2P0T1_HYPSF|nr:hypothetical protein HYPSUDRAFT_473830 [Hypholoma sublateritium FD-334 SS-4]
MYTILSRINSQIDNFKLEDIHPRIEGVAQILQDVSARLTSAAVAGLSNLQIILYSDLAEMYLSIALATWILSTTAMLSFWFGWTSGIHLYRLGVWLTRSATRGYRRQIIAKGVSVARANTTGGRHLLQTGIDAARREPEEAGTACRETSGIARTVSDAPVPEKNVPVVLLPAATADIEITTARVIKAGTPDAVGLEHAALSIPAPRVTRSGKYATPAPTASTTEDPVGLITPPSTPARSEDRGAPFGAAEVAVKSPLALGTGDACPTMPMQAAGKERRRSKRTAYKPITRPICTQAEAEIN